MNSAVTSLDIFLIIEKPLSGIYWSYEQILHLNFLLKASFSFLSTQEEQIFHNMIKISVDHSYFKTKFFNFKLSWHFYFQ